MAWPRGRERSRGRSEGIQTETGRLESGKYNGHWVVRFANANVGEGPFVNGQENGHWVLRDADGNVLARSRYVDGQLVERR